VAAIVRRAEAEGDFAAVMRKGDPDRGTILLLVASRGRHVACLERLLGPRWETVGPAEGSDSRMVADFLAKRERFDTDFWAIELDVAAPERFIAETTAVP
jgi:hypothetical protein